MRKIIFTFLIFLPFFLVAQTNKENENNFSKKKSETEMQQNRNLKVVSVKHNAKEKAPNKKKSQPIESRKRVSINVKENSETLKPYEDENH